MLIDKQVQPLPLDIIIKCLHRQSLGHPALKVLLSSVELATWLQILSQQMKIVEESQQSIDKNKVIMLLPVSVFLEYLMSLDSNPIRSELVHFTLQKILASTDSLAGQLRQLSLTPLLRFFIENSNALNASREIFITVMKEKITANPVRDNQLITENGNFTLPVECHTKGVTLDKPHQFTFAH
jgi:CRISPR/Cas system endoribonuclease Cas6 (RAMP superfamily)